MIIKFNIPKKNKYSKVKVQNLIHSKDSIRGPGKKYNKLKYFLEKTLALKTFHLLIAVHLA